MRSQDRATKVHRAVNTTHDNSFVTVMKCMTEKMSHLRVSSAVLLYDFFFVAIDRQAVNQCHSIAIFFQFDSRWHNLASD